MAERNIWPRRRFLGLIITPLLKPLFKSELSSSSPTVFGHNAALDREKMESMIKAGIKHLEIDVHFDEKYNRLCVAHDIEEVSTWNQGQSEQKTLSLILEEFASRGLHPHLDLKPSYSENILALLNNHLNSLPNSLEVTISGSGWGLLFNLAPNRHVNQVFFTVNAQDQIEEIKKWAPYTHYIDGKTFGTSLKDEIATPQNLNFLDSLGFKAIVWTVNDPSRAQQLAASPIVVGITTDNTQLL